MGNGRTGKARSHLTVRRWIFPILDRTVAGPGTTVSQDVGWERARVRNEFAHPVFLAGASLFDSIVRGGCEPAPASVTPTYPISTAPARLRMAAITLCAASVDVFGLSGSGLPRTSTSNAPNIPSART